MLDFASSVVDLLKKIVVLSLLIFCPDQDSYSPNKFKTLLQSSEIDLQKSKLSSAKNKWVSLGPRLHKEKPLISPFLTKCLMRA